MLIFTGPACCAGRRSLTDFGKQCLRFVVTISMILVSFRKTRDKATVSFFMSLCLSVRLEHLASHWTDFHEI